MLGKKEWLVLWAKLLQLYRSREGSQSVDKKNWLYGWWTFDQCGFWLTMLFWVNKIDKILHPKKPPVHLRWSWHWFSLTENFWTWLSETRSRGGARRAAQFFFSEKRPKLKILAFLRVSQHPQPMAQCFLVAPGLGKSEAQTYGLRPPPWASEMPRGPAWTLKIVPWAGGVGSYKNLQRIGPNKKRWPSMQPATMSYFQKIENKRTGLFQ